jgi:tetratricopeptide (TPR) repeat protein
MNQLAERIAQFRKMASDDPDNELGHFRLGQLLMEDKQFGEAVASFRRTLELSPQFSKVFQLLGQCLIELGQRDEAVQVLREGYAVADGRGDQVPREEMAKLLKSLGEEPPPPRKAAAAADVSEGSGGFRCQRPGCFHGSHARQLASPPTNDDLGRRVQTTICADCWNLWLRDFSVKVINELRLDLSTERGQEIYDQTMMEFFGFQ